MAERRLVVLPPSPDWGEMVFLLTPTLRPDVEVLVAANVTELLLVLGINLATHVIVELNTATGAEDRYVETHERAHRESSIMLAADAVGEIDLARKSMDSIYAFHRYANGSIAQAAAILVGEIKNRAPEARIVLRHAGLERLDAGALGIFRVEVPLDSNLNLRELLVLLLSD